MRPRARALRIAVYRLGRECWHAHRDVLGTSGLGRAVAYPLAPPGDDGLARAHVDRAAAVLDAEHPSQHDRVLVELRGLTGLDPARGAPHVRDAHGRRLRVHAADVLVDLLREIAGGDDAGGLTQ